MECSPVTAEQKLRLHQVSAVKNEQFAGECLKRIHAAPDAEEGLRRLLRYLGEELGCERVYVFEEMDRQHIRNTCEWCREGIPSGIKQLPYIAKKDLFPWFECLTKGENIIEPNVEGLCQSDPLIYGFLKPQQIRSIILSPLLAKGSMFGFLGADNPPPEKLIHISVLFDVLAYFVCSLINQRELEKLREAHLPARQPSSAVLPAHTGKSVLLVDDSPELLRLNERILRPEGYRILTARTLCDAKALLADTAPDAIVLDIDLPDGSGITFCRELQKTSDISVVFLTARSDAETAGEGLRTGDCALLTKPYLLEDLQAAVADAVEKTDIRRLTRQSNQVNIQ